MKLESVERIVYRFARQEIAALLKLLGKVTLPEITVFAEIPHDETVQSLTQSGIVLPAGERVFVDRVVALVLKTAADSTRYIAAKSQSGCAVLYDAEKLLVLAEDSGARIIRIEPLENFASAEEPWLRAVEKLGDKTEFLFVDGKISKAAAGDADMAKELLSQLTDREV